VGWDAGRYRKGGLGKRRHIDVKQGEKIVGSVTRWTGCVVRKAVKAGKKTQGRRTGETLARKLGGTD